MISKSVQTLAGDRTSPFYGRIQTSDEKKTTKRCISFASLFSALDKSDLYITATRKPGVIEYGPLWTGGDNEATRRRTVQITNKWFDAIRDAVPDWWELGSEPGGGLAMNDGVTACANVLRSVFQHVALDGKPPYLLDDDDLWERIAPYSAALGDYFRSLTVEERKQFRAARGVQGQTTRTKQCQVGIHERIPSFMPEGLDDFIATQKAQTNLEAKIVVDRIEALLQRRVLDVLRNRYGQDESQWWIEGVPKPVRVRATKQYEEDDGKRGGKEYYLNLIDYRTIILANWGLLGEAFGIGKQNLSKEKRTSWLNDVNEARNIVSHASAGRPVSLDQLSQLKDYDDWLTDQVPQAAD